MADLFEIVSTHPFVVGALLVICWLVVRYIATGRKRQVSDYAKKFSPVDVSPATATSRKSVNLLLVLTELIDNFITGISSEVGMKFYSECKEV